jgi:hypothetical protein
MTLLSHATPDAFHFKSCIQVSTTIANQRIVRSGGFCGGVSCLSLPFGHPTFEYR